MFTRLGRVWTQQAKLIGTGAIIGPFGVVQGSSVSLSGDGNTAIIGGPGDNSEAGNGGNINPGAAWVFTRSRGVWTQLTKLVGTGAIGPAAQGESVALSRNGNTAIVGGYEDNNTAGAAWVYVSFAGTPGAANCYGKSVAALDRQYGGLNNAAAALGFNSVKALQGAIEEFCEA